MSAARVFLNWDCPECGQSHHDEQDPVLGPFHTVTCDNCGMASDLHDVIDTVTEEAAP